jgi:hypothetical protein
MSDRSDYQGPKYPTDAHGSIPAFKSYEEEAAFWDTHDFSDVQDQTTPVKVRSTRGLSENVQVRFDAQSDRELEALASQRGLKKSTLIRTWVLERLREEHDQRVS